MLQFLPSIPASIAKFGWIVVLFLGAVSLAWKSRIASASINSGELKGTVLPPQIWGAPTNEAMWRSVRLRARAGDRSAIWARRLGWCAAAGAACLIAFPKA